MKMRQTNLEVNSNYTKLDLLDKSTHFSENEHAYLHRINIESMQSIIKDLNRLKVNGKLRGKQYSRLLNRIYSGFIENEINIRLKRVFSKNPILFDGFFNDDK